MLTIANNPDTAASAGYFAWAILIVLVPVGLKYLLDIVRDARNKGDSKDETAQKLIAERDAKIAELRHEALASSISAVGEKIDSTNKRIQAIELEITRLRDSDTKLSMEIERMRVAREAA